MVNLTMHYRLLCIVCMIFLMLATVDSSKQDSPRQKGKYSKKPVAAKTLNINSDSDVFKYLTQFGYNECEKDLSSTTSVQKVSCQSDLPSMIGKYQSAYGLPVTKQFDAKTKELMNTPRCGFSDAPAAMLDRSKLW